MNATTYRPLTAYERARLADAALAEAALLNRLAALRAQREDIRRASTSIAPPQS